MFWSIGPTLNQAPNAQWPISALFLGLGALLIASGISDSLWQFIGREQLEASSSQIVLRHRLAGMGFAMTFGANQIGAVFVSHEQPGWYQALGGYGMHFLDFKGGRVAINTGKSLFGVVTHRFGSSLRPDEAHEVVEMILTRFPQYEYGPLRLS